MFNPFFSNAFNISSNFVICDFFVRSSNVALQYFLLYKQSNITFIYDYLIYEDIFIGIL